MAEDAENLRNTDRTGSPADRFVCWMEEHRRLILDALAVGLILLGAVALLLAIFIASIGKLGTSDLVSVTEAGLPMRLRLQGSGFLELETAAPASDCRTIALVPSDEAVVRFQASVMKYDDHAAPMPARHALVGACIALTGNRRTDG